jgi:hypothetical protein
MKNLFDYIHLTVMFPFSDACVYNDEILSGIK